MKRNIFRAVCILFAVIFAHLETKNFGVKTDYKNTDRKLN